jgi:hypothetical protein
MLCGAIFGPLSRYPDPFATDNRPARKTREPSLGRHRVGWNYLPQADSADLRPAGFERFLGLPVIKLCIRAA